MKKYNTKWHLSTVATVRVLFLVIPLAKTEIF